MELQRRQDETAFQYHQRIIRGKLVDHTLSDIDYSELSQLAYGQSYSSDVARRMFYGSRRTLDLLDAEKYSEKRDNDIVSDLDDKIAEFKREQKKFYDQRREYNKLITDEARAEHLYDSLRQAASGLSENIGAIYPNAYYDYDSIGNSEAVLVFSDWHYGLKTINVFNDFNTEICRDRVRHVVKAAAARISFNNCRKLHLVILGDMFHGAIHTSARVASEELVCDQIMQVSEILAQSIEELNRYVPEINVYMTYGNHARTVQNKSDSIHRDNIERIIPWWLTERLQRYEGINIADPYDSEFIVFNVCGHDMVAVHGDNDSVRTAPRILPSLFQKKYGRNIEYILLGDKHHRESFDELGCTAFLCGALCGADDYANDKRMYSKPSQMLLIVNENSGVDCEYRLSCDLNE